MLRKISSIIILGIVMAACSPSTQNVFTDHQMKTIYIDQKPLQVELVTTSESTQQGLSGRQEIGAEGMLFIFPSTQQRSFWMKDMQFAIDIVWIRDGIVVGIAEQVPAPAPNTELSQLPLYSSDLPVDMVLELPAGDAEQRGLSIGSQINLEQNSQ